MTNCNCQGIGSIRLGYFRQSQKGLEHLLNLPLFGTSLADHCLFDLQCRIFGHRQIGVDRGYNRCSASLAQLESTLDIGREKYVFNGNLIRLVLENNLAQAVKYPLQPSGEIVGAVGKNGTVVNMDKSVTGLVNDAVTGNPRAGVNAENSHLKSAAAAVFGVILLMVGFGFPKYTGRHDFGDDSAPQAA